ncbi:hypothetical protein [Prosthecobacter fluviatilis]|uniref:HEAT repeat domain-containing protein n=1 Tax=Prosthecobacter fluviatilis TaxID=445931 RepID=A0ABW0KPP5_9BACT
MNLPSTSLQRSLRLLRWALLSASLTLPALLCSQTVNSDPFVELDYYKMRHVRELVSLALDDSIPADAAEGRAMQKAQEEKDLRCLHALRTEPGLGPYLTALAGTSFIQKAGTGDLPRVFEAMAMRQDTEPSVIQHYIQLAKMLLDKAPKKLDSHEYDLLLGIRYLLSLHATPENEDLLIRILTLGEKLDDMWLILSAAEALSKTGTGTRSLEAMETALHWFQQLREKNESRAPLLLKMEGFLKALNNRIHSTSPRSI